MDELQKDPRFAHIGKDPRFRPASKNDRKLKIDRRFASMFNDPKFKLKYTVDKRGRPLVKEHTTRDDMNKFYHLDEDEEESGSSSEDEEVDTKERKERKASDEEELDELLESDDEEDEKEEEEEEESSSSEEDEEAPDAEDGVEWNEFDDKCTRSEDTSCRLAVCNMDWDRVRAVDILLLLNSWKPADGVIKSVTIYPSEYGLKQIQLEKKYGPLPGAAQPVATTEQNGTDSGHQSDAEEEPELPEVKSDDDEEPNFNQDDDPDTTDPVMRERLRKYQLNRLKYYYAVVECDTPATAAHIYKECDGLEYETSAVRLDLRFIPDSVTFDPSQLHDQCTQLPDKSLYKPILFRNTALTQTKVRCTWDETPIDRRRLTRKKYTLEELEKADLDAYLASESEEELDENDDDDLGEESGDEEEKKNDNGVFKVPDVPAALTKKTRDQPIARAPSVLSSQDDIDRYRSLLLDFSDDQKQDKKSKKKITNFFDEPRSDDEDSNEGIGNEDDDDDDDDDGSDIDMEITWQPGLKGKADQQIKNGDHAKETKQNKNKKPEKANHRKAESDEDEDEDEDEKNDGASETDHQTLQLLADDDETDGKRDFNLRDMIKSHKQATKAAAKNAKKSKKSQQGSSSTTEENKKTNDAFELNVNDKRFQAVFNQPAFNIDQTDPHFKATAGTQQLIEEKLKKRKLDSFNSSSRTDRDEDDIVVKLKRKTAKKD